MSQSKGAWGRIFVMALCGAAFAWMMVDHLNHKWHAPPADKVFSREKWQAEPAHRYPMTASLISDVLPKLASQEQLIAELGQPDVKWESGEGTFWMYAVGMQRDYPEVNVFGQSRSSNVDVWYLLVHFSKRNSVSFRIVAT